MDQVFIKDSMLKNHIHKCRCCLKKFEFDSQTVQVTKLIEKLFYDFTGIELRNSKKYSNNICTICKKDLIYYSDLRRLLAAKQLKIYEFVEERDKCFEYDSNFDTNQEYNKELLEFNSDLDLIAEEDNKTEQDTEKPKAKLIVETFKWPELKNDSITEKNHTQNKVPSKCRKSSVEQYCEICKLFFSDKYKYKLHYERRHLKNKNNLCDICGFSACSKGEIVSHMKGKHFPKELKEFPCPLCNKILSSPSCLRIHIISHDNKSNHHCQVCGFAFKTNINVKRHIKRVHDKVTNFKCNVPSCDKAYYSKVELRTHYSAIHTKVICELKCKYCEKLYNSELSFVRHLKSHTNPQWRCNLCDEKFFKKGLLTNHKRSTHWKNP